ncbi:MAG TPA: DUF6600 domain-containing protein [Thermoanaerobaculia bacterium]
MRPHRIERPHAARRAPWLVTATAAAAALALAWPLVAQVPAQAPAQAPDAGDGYGYAEAPAGAYQPAPTEDPGGAYAPADDANLADAADDASVNDPSAPPPAGSYGYFRIVEGQATDFPAGGADRSPAEVNQPVLAGDRIAVPRGSRVEIVLPDRNLLRLDGGSEVVLDRLAGSADSQDRETRLRLIQGNLQLVVVADALGDPLPRIDTENASVYVDYAGAYRVTANATDWTSLVVRRGTADLATESATTTVRAGQEGVAQGARDAEAEVRAAGAWDTLERWGRQLSDQIADQIAAAPAAPEVDESLSYSASSLGQYGSWIDVEGARYWRPRVDNGWRPYWHGRWVSTPSGLTWVAYEPWGWVPYHYGTWDYLPAYGWVWAPGYVYAPAWVYWYWGPSFTGWCPVGYYTGFYRHHFHDPGFRLGVYGWAGGDWGFFSRWSFVGSGHFGRRDLDRWALPGDALRDRVKLAELPRGVITTDTRGITPGRWGNPRQVLSILEHRPAGRGGSLPDVTPFIARNPRLPTSVLHAVATDGPAKGRLTGTPLRPATLETRPAFGDRGDRAPRRPGLPTAIASRPRAGRLPAAPGPRGDGVGADRTLGRVAPAGHAWRDRADRAGRERTAVPGLDRPERPRIVIPPRQPRQPGEERDGRPAPPPARDLRRPEAATPRVWERPQAVAPREAYPGRPSYAPPLERARPSQGPPPRPTLAPRESYRAAPRYERPAEPRTPAPAARQAPPPPSPPAQRAPAARPPADKPHPR